MCEAIIPVRLATDGCVSHGESQRWREKAVNKWSGVFLGGAVLNSQAESASCVCKVLNLGKNNVSVSGARPRSFAHSQPSTPAAANCERIRIHQPLSSAHGGLHTTIIVAERNKATDHARRL
jgi:hypothetical protein